MSQRVMSTTVPTTRMVGKILTSVFISQGKEGQAVPLSCVFLLGLSE